MITTTITLTEARKTGVTSNNVPSDTGLTEARRDLQAGLKTGVTSNNVPSDTGLTEARGDLQAGLKLYVKWYIDTCRTCLRGA